MTKEERMEKFFKNWEIGEEMVKFIKEIQKTNPKYSYHQFVRYCIDNDKKDWIHILRIRPGFTKYFYPHR